MGERPDSARQARRRCGAVALGIVTALGALVSPFQSSASSPRWWSEPPGAVAYPAPLARAIDRALPRRAAGAPPRFANRLALEPSPYLKRHADDAVDWWPWSAEAFATAHRLDRPVFLSIGYLACGGCHAMETECFENESLARQLNERYVAILVDREERPEVEAVYLRTLRSLGLEPGWPMTLWLLPDGRAFFAGTYYPAEDSTSGPGLRSLVERLAKRFRENRAPLEAAASSLALAAAVDDGPPGDPGPPEAPPTVSATEQATRRVVSELERRFDWQHGGLAGAPKFPNDVPVRLLLAHDALAGDARARSMAVRTLEALQASSLRDPLSGGFHRYATDEAWRLPHYEKMLADNALLTLAFLDGFRATGRQDFAAVARETVDFLLDELADPVGGFYAALDAVSPDGVEGGSYTWTREEIDRVLGAETAIFFQAYRLTSDGEGRGILAPEEGPAKDSGEQIARLRTRLLTARRQRPRPARDEQLVLGSNGLAISALARAGRLLEEPRFLDAASKAAGRFLAGRRAGALPRILRAGSPPATLSDLAALCGGLLDLLEATGEVRWFEAARLIEKEIAARFERAAIGGFLSGEGIERVPGEPLPDLDDSLAPSGNALHLDNLWRLAAFTGDSALRRRATRAVEALASRWRRAPGRSTDFLRAALIAERPPLEIVIAVPRHAREAEPFLRVLRARLLPQAVSIVVTQGRAAAVSRGIPLVVGKLPRRGKPTAFLCRGFVCDRPTSDAGEFARQLTKAAALQPPINPGT